MSILFHGVFATLKTSLLETRYLNRPFLFFSRAKHGGKKEERSHEGYRLSFFAIAGRIVLPI